MRMGMDALAESLAEDALPLWLPAAESLLELDLYSVGISTIIWATSFQLDLQLVGLSRGLECVYC